MSFYLQLLHLLQAQGPMSIGRLVGLLQFAKAHGAPLTFTFHGGHYYVNGYIDTFLVHLFHALGILR